MAEARITMRTRASVRNVRAWRWRRQRLTTHRSWVTILIRRHMLTRSEGLGHVLPRAEGRGRHDPTRTEVGSRSPKCSRRHNLTRTETTRSRRRGGTAGRETLMLRSER